MIDPGPHTLTQSRPVLLTSGDMEVRKVTPGFFAELQKDHPADGGSLISSFAFDEPWGVWEMHPSGDEFVYLLSGDTDFVLHDGKHEVGRVRINQPGDYVMVPKGCWHTAYPHVPTNMLFVTPGDGTLNANEPGGEPLQY
jgi:uncharacterized cupin superfamily protein